MRRHASACLLFPGRLQKTCATTTAWLIDTAAKTCAWKARVAHCQSDRLCACSRRLAVCAGLYAGGSGIDDRLAVRCRIDLAHWPDVVSRLRLKSVHDVSCDADWQEDFRWLIDAQDAEGRPCPLSSLHQCGETGFQDKVDHRWEIFFSHGSDINAWCAVWRSQEHLNYLSFDQG